MINRPTKRSKRPTKGKAPKAKRPGVNSTRDKIVARSVKELTKIATDERKPIEVRVGAMALARAKARRGKYRSFEAAVPMPGVIPKNCSSMALDAAPMNKRQANWAMDSVMSAPGWGASTLYSAMWSEGMSFQGYPFLAELAQIPEYRRITEITATEMTRMWVELKSKSSDEDESGEEDDKEPPDVDADPDDEADEETEEESEIDTTAETDNEPSGGAKDADVNDPPENEEAATEPVETDPAENKDEDQADAQTGQEAEGQPKGKTAQQKTQDKINRILDRMEELRVRDAFRKCAELDGFFGRGHLYLDFGDSDDRPELVMPIGDGTSELSKLKVSPDHPLIAVRPIEPVWTYPANYNANDPMLPTWYHPETWFVMGKEVHSTRLLTFVGREVPDMLKPSFSFGGLSLSQMAMPYVNNWLRTRQSISDLIHSFSVSGIQTNLQASLQADGNQLFERLDMFNTMKDNQGVMLLQNGAEADREEFFNISTPLGTLDALQSQAQEHMASVSGIPIIKLLGIQPAGLNASSEGEIRTWYDWVGAQQERLFSVQLKRVINFIQLSLFGEVDDDIIFEFKPLWTLDEKGMAEVRKLEAETGDTLIQAGAISAEEERKRVVSDSNSPYNGLDPDEIPEPPEPDLSELAGVIPGAAGPGGAAKPPGGGSKGGAKIPGAKSPAAPKAPGLKEAK